MRGLSGAVVTVVDDVVIKHGGIPERTREQGEWILQHSRGFAFPKVYGLQDDGYIMEKLDYIEYWETSSSEMVDMLSEYVWAQPPVVAPSAKTLTLLLDKMEKNVSKYLTGLIDTATVEAIFEDAEYAATGALQHRHCLTHGDPTAENVMARAGFGKVLIDPIRATDVVPDSPAVDIGKMLQSACGWEHAKYGTGEAGFTREGLRAAVGDDELFSVGEAWATVHIIRAVPYVFRGMPDIIDPVVEVLKRAIERK